MLYLITYLRNGAPPVFICICSERIICSFRIMYLYSLASLLQGTACQYLNAPCVPGKDVLSAAECSIYATSVLMYDPVMYYSVPLLFFFTFIQSSLLFPVHMQVCIQHKCLYRCGLWPKVHAFITELIHGQFVRTYFFSVALT